MNNETELIIKLPSQLHIDGNFKTYHSIDIECNFKGTLLSKNKVIIEPNSTFEGDIICSNLDLSGKIKGNIFCTGKVHAKEHCEVVGNIYTCRFENDETTNLECLITVPKTIIINKIKSILKEIDLNQNLRDDPSLTKIMEWFKKIQLTPDEKKELGSLNIALENVIEPKKDGENPSNIDYNSGVPTSQRISVLNLKK